jgi:hypothetical protein
VLGHRFKGRVTLKRCSTLALKLAKGFGARSPPALEMIDAER